MGTLRYVGIDGYITLRSRTLLGRSPACDVRLNDPRISGEHASVCWTGEWWELRDLGSKNGTYLDGRRLATGERMRLVAGSTLGLGMASGVPGEMALSDASAPVAAATHLGTGAIRYAQTGVLLLPVDEHPRASLLEAEDGRWRLETVDEVQWVSSGDVVMVEGERYRFDLPLMSSTVDATATVRTIDSISLSFGVSSNEEQVELVVAGGGEETLLPPRSFQYMLLTLARARLSDASRRPEARGWVERDDLCRMLKIDQFRLNVDVCRARKQLASLGIEGASNIVQRRVGTGRLRLGVERVSVQRL